MKICILTQPLNFNYGGILQAYALQKVLREMGHNVVTDRLGAPHRLSFCDRVARFMLHSWKRYIGGYVLFNPFRFLFCGLNRSDEYASICVNIERFIAHNINCINFFEGELAPSSQTINEFDALVVGSDQVWRAEYNYLPAYFLSFTQNSTIKRISYAASFGIDNIDNYNNSIRSKCGEWLARFDGVSVREESGVDICHNSFNVDAEVVLDPTMLLTKEDYSTLIELQNPHLSPKKMGQLMTYILNEDAQRDEILDVIASRLSLSPLDIIPKGVFDRRTKSLEDSILPSIEEWLAGFRDSEFVVTDSFHGAVFSIIFNTPFVVIDNHERGSERFNSLLKIFGLERRKISSASEIDNRLLNDYIDWAQINDIRKGWAEKSLHFLALHLNELNNGDKK